MEDYLLTLKNKHLLLLLQQKKINDTTVEIKEFTYIRKSIEDMVMEKALIQHIEKLYQNKLTFLIGTANSSMTNMLIYTKLGYHYSHKN